MSLTNEKTSDFKVQLNQINQYFNQPAPQNNHNICSNLQGLNQDNISLESFLNCNKILDVYIAYEQYKQLQLLREKIETLNSTYKNTLPPEVMNVLRTPMQINQFNQKAFPSKPINHQPLNLNLPNKHMTIPNIAQMNKLNLNKIPVQKECPIELKTILNRNYNKVCKESNSSEEDNIKESSSVFKLDYLRKRVKFHFCKYLFNRVREILNRSGQSELFYPLPTKITNEIRFSQNKAFLQVSVKDLFSQKIGKDKEDSKIESNREILNTWISNEFEIIKHTSVKDIYIEYINSSTFNSDLKIMRIKYGEEYENRVRSIAEKFLNFYLV